MNAEQLNRLHSILKPFMLRRIKKDVECEMVKKIEIEVVCDLSLRQRILYGAIKGKLSLQDILSKAGSGATDSHLMNLVMQLRKVRVVAFGFLRSFLVVQFFHVGCGHIRSATTPTCLRGEIPSVHSNSRCLNRSR